MPDDADPAAFDASQAALVSRRNLPHWRQHGGVYFVTFRLADSLPAEKLHELRLERQLRMRTRADLNGEPPALAWDSIQSMDAWLDAGYGSCWLGNPAAADVMENTLRFFAGTRYALGSYAILPNHVHVLVSPRATFELSAILHSWKSFSAQQINRAFGRRGALWQDESFDHIVRDDESLNRFTAYI